MSFENVSEDPEANDATGWIASTDVFMLSTVVILAISFGMVRYSNSQSSQLIAFAETERQQKENVTSLEAKIKEIQGEVEKLRSENLKLIEDNKQIEELLKSRSQLEKSLAERIQKLAELETRIEQLMANVVVLKNTVTSLEQERDQLQDSNRKRDAKINEFELAIAALRQELTKSKETIAERESKIAELVSKVGELDAEKERLGLVANSIVALRGNLRNVVFVFDSSESMKNSGRFEASKNLLTEWVDNLQMDRFGIIDFDSDVRHFSNALVECNDDGRSRAKEFISSIEAAGLTRTGIALDEVFKHYPAVDTVVLFTDGRATDAEGHEVSKESADEIRKKIFAAHPEVVINTIGIGDYIHKTAGKSDSGDAMEFGFFLQMIAKDHKGVFIGIGDAN